MSDYTNLAAVKATLSLNTQTTYADADITAAITSASRAIDNLCQRRFYEDADANQVRYYTPDRPDKLEIDDLVNLTSLLTDDNGDGSFSATWARHTDFELEPLNADADGWPFTRVKVRRTSGRQLMPGWDRSVKVTGQFGWAAVPQGIVDATVLIASQIVRRKREAPFGIVALGQDGFAVRIARSDSQVCMLLDPYRRHRVAIA